MDVFILPTLGGLAIGLIKANWDFKNYKTYLKATTLGLVSSAAFFALGITVFDINVYRFLNGAVESRVLNGAGAFAISALGALALVSKDEKQSG